MKSPLFAQLTSVLVLGALCTAAYAQDPGKQIKIVLATPVDTVDSCNMSRGYIGSVLKQNVVETLTQLDLKDSKVLPRLALSWERRNPTTWRIKLRQGVKFHDGGNFDANAVTVALNRILDPALPCVDKFKFLPNIKLKSQAIDSHTLDITTEQPLALFPVYLAQLGMSSPKTDSSKLTTKPVGTGPYVFASWDPTSNVVLKRFDGYWGAKPEVQQATYVWRSESALRASMVEVGEADIGVQIAIQDATNPKTDFSYLNSDTTRIRMIMQAPLDDLRVRKALNLSFNRAALVGSVFSPKVIPASQQMLPSISGHNPELKTWPFDQTEAKRLIKEAKAAGVPVDKEITLYGRNNMHANGEEGLQAMIQMWQEVGLNVKLKMLESSQWLKLVNKPYADNRPPMLIQEMHDNSFGDAAFTMMFYYTSEGNKSDLTDANVDKLLNEASVSTGNKRKGLFQEANKYIQQQIVPDVMMFHMISVIRVNPRLTYQPNLATNAKIELSDIRFKK
jgi:peptide/nickel transport system substrate-binding protein